MPRAVPIAPALSRVAGSLRLSGGGDVLAISRGIETNSRGGVMHGSRAYGEADEREHDRRGEQEPAHLSWSCMRAHCGNSIMSRRECVHDVRGEGVPAGRYPRTTVTEAAGRRKDAASGSRAARAIEVVLDGPPTVAWQVHALRRLAGSPSLEVVQVRLVGPRSCGVLARARAAIERRLLRLGPDALASTSIEQDALASAAIEGEAPGSVPIEGDVLVAEPVDARTRAQRDNAGLVVWLSERPAPARGPREVVYVRHGQLTEPAESALSRALCSGASSVQTDVLLHGAGGTSVVERTVSGVRPFSVTLSRDLLLWKLVAVVPRALERLPGLNQPVPAPAPDARALPSSTRLLTGAFAAWGRVLVSRLLFRRPWSIRMRLCGPEPASGWSGTKDGHYTGECLVRWRRGHVYADPHLIEHEGRHHLFCEEVPLGAKRGVISHTELRLDGAPADPPEPILQQPYHLSYPFVFEREGEMFMIPETLATRRVELYRAHDFPLEWRSEAVLLHDVAAVDATIFCADDRLWLFAGISAPHASSCDELHLFWASAPRGPWHSHPRNPIVSDVRCARPAGALQKWGSRLIRPAQDCSRRYGGSISFREIDVLSTTDYAEHEVDRLDPDDLGNARATHTYASDGRFEAVDLRRRELRASLEAARLGARIRAGHRSGQRRA